ncbi:hypothetical protein [Oscillibacter sp.]|uniref:hypothetical protein n=1 Tax=Oscillibacter sp. TaxID=1945593 RepID=UPI002635FCC0|nr:hypothetical protein [Oscillibacter sp.]MDD3346268.1 hypothetical protein [Oscillibacter sp.]
MTEKRRSFAFDVEQPAQYAAQRFRGLPYNDIHTKTPFFYRLQQAQPHAISKNATRNSKAPTGKIAAIKIPEPSATAQNPRIQQPPPP